MRWGEPTRLPPVRRGRGLTAAALLAVGLVAAYAILAVLSLTSVAPSLLEHVPTTLQGIIRPGSVSAAQPKPADVVTPTKSVTLGDLSVQFGFSTGSNTKVFGLENTATLPIDLSLEVVGAPGVQAAFEGSGTRTHLGVGKQTKVTVTTDPLHAGALTGSVDISISGVSQTLSVPLTGAQAPLPPGAVVATPEANGAVKVTWPASPSTGVAGYRVLRRVSDGPWRTVAANAPAAGLVDATGTDGRTVDYQVSAITAGVRPILLSSSVIGSAVTDASAPDPAKDITIAPGFINLENQNAVPVEVDLPPTSAPTDVVSVTLTDGTGGSATATSAGGQPSVVIPIDATGLAQGPIQSSVTLEDALGNVTPAAAGPTVQKDTVAPEAPTGADAPEVVNGNIESAVPVSVHLADAEPDERVHVEITGGAKTADASADASGAVTVVNVDASNLPDGPLTVSAWAVDEAGNTSKPSDSTTITKDTSAPEAAANIRVLAGDSNPAGYVNAASANSVMAVVHFHDVTDPSLEIGISVDGIKVHRDGGNDTYLVGPFDLSSRPDGTVPLSVTVTDSAGNSSTTTDSAIKDTVAPAPPTSFTVPESADNPAGFVNSVTQTAAIIQATFPDGTDSTDSLTASVNGIDLGARIGGSIAVQWKADVSGLPDGQLDLAGTITDAAGNSTDFSGRAVKETQAPPPPVAAHVIGFCQPDTITPSTAPDVSVQVVLPDMPGLAGDVTVTLTDSAGHTASGTAFGGPGIVVVHGIDASSFVPGSVHVAVSVTDAAGNTSTFDGTTADYINPDE
jgi:Bacterial Ig-like domain